MTYISRFLVAAILAVIASCAAAGTLPCTACDPTKQDSSHRDQIRAERAKYNRENEKIIARPWDVIKPDRPDLDKKN